MTDNDRKGRPSASAMLRLSLCPGSLALCNTMGAPSMGGTAPDPDNEYAADGTVIHDVVHEFWKTGEIPTVHPTASFGQLARSERIVCDSVDCLNRALEHVGQPSGFTMDSIHHRFSAGMLTCEERVWDETSMGHRYSGRYDLFAQVMTPEFKRIGILIDYKSGWGRDAGPAETNLQLRTLAVLVNEEAKMTNPGNLGYHEIVTGIVQPNLGLPRLTTYDARALVQSREQIYRIVDLASLDSSPRIPHPLACKYCEGRVACPEANAAIASMKMVADMPADLSSALDACVIAQMCIDDIRSRAKSALKDDPNAIPNWELAPPRKLRNVTDLTAAIDRLNISTEDFLRCCKLSLPKLSKIDPYAPSQIADLITVTETERSLRRTGDNQKESPE